MSIFQEVWLRIFIMEDYKHDGKPVYRFLQSNYRENLDCRREYKNYLLCWTIFLEDLGNFTFYLSH